MGSNTQQRGSGEYRGEGIIFTHVVCGNSHHLDSGESNYDFFPLPFHCLPLRRVVSQRIIQWTWRAKAGCPASITTTPTSSWWMTAPTDNTARRLNYVAVWRNASPESFLETKVKNSCKWYHLISVSIYLLCFDYWFFFFLLRSREQRDHPCGVCGSGRRSWHSECESSIFIFVLCLCLSCLTLVCLSQTIYNAMLNGTPCVVLEGSGRIADVIAHVAGLPMTRVTITLIHMLMKKFFGPEYDTFPDLNIIRWTKMVRGQVQSNTVLYFLRTPAHVLSHKLGGFLSGQVI